MRTNPLDGADEVLRAKERSWPVNDVMRRVA
jgi:hypothetical protein